MRRVLPVLVCCAVGLTAPGLASAATLTASGNVITYQAGPGEQNRLSVNWGTGRPTFGDSPDITVQVGAGCRDTYGDGLILECPSAGADPLVVARLGDGDDQAQIVGEEQRGHHAELHGDAGNDQLSSAEGSDLLDGGDGDDQLEPDDMDSGGTAGSGDTVLGGPGRDRLQLVNSPQSTLTATLDGVADDGGPGEADNYGTDIEDVQGSRGAQNTIVGTPGPNTITIISDDRVPNAIAGGAGDDVLSGGAGTDRLDGGDGNDTLDGSGNDDVLVGGPGLDALSGDGSSSYGGNDRIEARDGVAEAINCGIGADTVIADATDTVPSDPGSICEVVDRGPTTTAPVGPLPPAGTAPTAISVRSSSLRRRDGRIGVTAACPAGGATCRGTLRVKTLQPVKVGSKRAVVTVLSAAYVIGAGHSRTLRVKPSSRGRSLLRRTTAVRVRVELDPAGAGATVRRTLTLRRS